MSQRMIVAGHRVESPSRVVHNLRPAGPVAGNVELHVADYITDDKHILPDFAEVDVSITATPVPAEKGAQQ